MIAECLGQSVKVVDPKIFCLLVDEDNRTGLTLEEPVDTVDDQVENLLILICGFECAKDFGEVGVIKEKNPFRSWSLLLFCLDGIE